MNKLKIKLSKILRRWAESLNPISLDFKRLEAQSVIDQKTFEYYSEIQLNVLDRIRRDMAFQIANKLNEKNMISIKVVENNDLITYTGEITVANPPSDNH